MIKGREGLGILGLGFRVEIAQTLREDLKSRSPNLGRGEGGGGGGGLKGSKKGLSGFIRVWSLGPRKSIPQFGAYWNPFKGSTFLDPPGGLGE